MDLASNEGDPGLITCTPNSYSYLKFGTTQTPSTFSGIFKTNVKGLGIKIWNTSSGMLVLDNTLKQWYKHTPSPFSGKAWLNGIKAQYYIIGSLETGTVVPDITIEAWGNTQLSTTGGVNYTTLTIKGSAKIVASACETPDISVDLKKQDGYALKTVGATTPTTPFNFQINDCDEGINSVNYTFYPAPGIALAGSGASQHLTLDSRSTSSGVGVQVLYENGTLVPFNSKTRFTGYKSTSRGSYTIPMKARYIRTGHILGGTANSAVEFVMSYE